jgi:hypothetical protein
MADFHWTHQEKQIARRAFEKAYQIECWAILGMAKKMLSTASAPKDLWRLHDFLTEQRRDTDRKYDYSYSMLIQVFARLIFEGWMSEEDIAGLAQDKRELGGSSG